MSKPYFFNAKVGDRVQSYSLGEGEIAEIGIPGELPISAWFSELQQYSHLTIDGLRSPREKRQDTFYAGVKFTVEPPKRMVEKKIDCFVGLSDLDLLMKENYCVVIGIHKRPSISLEPRFPATLIVQLPEAEV